MKLLLSDDQQTFKEAICFIAINDDTNECVPVAVVIKNLMTEKEIQSTKQDLRRDIGANIITKNCKVILDEPVPTSQE